ncbi:MAG: DNA alkylation repair protein [Candidatus Methanoplasma sp.]|nr:DNA alkylation repair protein [Candidatus Methanoplasma sp.]
MIDIKKELNDNIDQKYQKFHTGIIPGAKEILGVRVPVLRDISKRICTEDWRSFLKEPAVSHEEQMLKALVIGSAAMSVEERLALTKEFVPEIGNWAVCDTLCGSWKVKKQDKEKLWSYCLDLMRTDDEFKMRVSAVMMLYHFVDDDHIDDVLRSLTSRYHPGYYYRMGAAWALADCFIKFPEKTEPMLFLDSLDKDIRNKAVQKISDSFRVSKEDKERLKDRKRTC